MLLLAALLAVAGLAIRFLIVDVSAPFIASQRRFLDEVAPLLRQSRSVEILSLQPYDGTGPDEARTLFLGYPVLGRAAIDPSTQARLFAALDQAIRGREEYYVACFNPRHGIIATSPGHRVELAICFECQSIEATIDGRRSGVLITGDPVDAFDAALDELGLERAPPPH